MSLQNTSSLNHKMFKCQELSDEIIINALCAGYSVSEKVWNGGNDFKVLGAISRTTESFPGLFIVIEMHF